MKRLYLARHAKSSWKSSVAGDFERPLNKRGLKAVPLMGGRLRGRGCALDLLCSSPARRAEQTARMLAAAVGFPVTAIRYEPVIYAAEVETLIALVRALEEEFSTVMLIGHNPGLSELGAWLCAAAPDWLPTCGLLELELPVARWDRVEPGCARLLEYDFPKNLG
jgi:phosphohistidine phosphatase